MKTILHLLCLFLVNTSFSQVGKHSSSKITYADLSNISFECAFKPSDKALSKACLKSGLSPCTHFLSAHFGADSLYHFKLIMLEYTDSILVERTFQFSGKYKLDSNAGLQLLGDHPFRSSFLYLQKKKRKDHVYILGFEFRLRDSFAAITLQKRFAICDGTCGFDGAN